MLRTVVCQIYPTTDQASRLFHFLHVGRKLYNHSLEQRIQHYKDTSESLTYYDQQRDLTVLRSVSQVLADVPVLIERDALQRLDKAYANFFRRVKEGKEKPGFPRFKGMNRWNSFSIHNPGKVVRSHDRVRISGVDGLLRTRGLREFTGTIKQQRIVLRAGRWFCQLVVDYGLELPPLQPIKSAIGIDLGLKSFAVLSNGETVDNPRFYRKLERRLKRQNRRVSRKDKGSKNQRKAVLRLQRSHLRITDQRSNFTHHLSKRIVSEHQLIAVEKLNIVGMVRSGRFSKSIMDAAWGRLLHQLAYKAEEAGCMFATVDPKGTSQDCSGCGERVQKDLSVRVHHCPKCGLQLDRDHNAALNILQRAVKSTSAPGIGVSKACGSATKPKRSRKSELAVTPS